MADIVFFPVTIFASGCAAKMNNQSGKALVTLLEGKAFRITKATTRQLPLTEGDYVYRGAERSLNGLKLQAVMQTCSPLRLRSSGFVRVCESAHIRINQR